MKKLSLIVILLALLGAGCHRMHSDVKGNGKRQVQKREVPAFTTIDTEGALNITVVCQQTQSVEIEADENILPLIIAEVSHNALRFRSTKSYSVSEPIAVRIAVPTLEGLSVSGAGKIEITGLKSEKFEIDSNGAPQIKVAGATKLVDIDTNGAARIDTHGLHASKGIVESKGVSKIDVDVADQLDVTISGPSIVTYDGDPTINKTIHGPGKLQKRASEGAWEIRIAKFGSITS